MRKTMRVGFYQFSVKHKHKDKEHNLKNIEENLRQAEFALVVLPELFTSGYYFQSKEELLPFAESLDQSETVRRLTKIAAEKNGYIVGTMPERDGDRVYNTGIVIGSTGLIDKQRKIHLPVIEKKIFDAGCEIKLISLPNTKIGITTCFDVWFPEMMRILKKEGAEIICQPANFGGPLTLDIIRTRAIENQLFTVTCNRTGTEVIEGEKEVFRGSSRIIDRGGNILVKTSQDEELCLIEIDPIEASQKEMIYQKKEHVICDDFFAELDKYGINMRH